MSEERFGRYRLLGRLGAGGMAEVFRAELVGAEGVTRELVVKKIRHDLSLDPEAVDMFVSEARIAAMLRHPNVVQVYELGHTDDGYFLAMELVDGCDLATLFRSAQKLSLGAVAWVFSEVLAALDYVHTLRGADGAPLGLVHRDVTPHNVLLGAAGEVKLADFGIATARADRSDGIRGKCSYMAPEQARGEALDARADLFAVGAMLYEVLSGQRIYPPSEGDVPSDAVREGCIAPLREVAAHLHGALIEVVTRATAATPEHRYDDARSFRRALAEAFEAAGVRPDREALQLAVATLRNTTSSATERQRADRTLTAQEDAPLPLATTHEGPTTVRRSRQLLERVAIAMGVFTLAVLAERRTRVAVHAASGLRVAFFDKEAARWFVREAAESAARACRCRVEARVYPSVEVLTRWLATGEVDLALVGSIDASLALAAGAARREVQLAGATVRADVADALASAGIAQERGFVAVGVDPVVLAYRPMAVERLDARIAATRLMLERDVATLTGDVLPPGYVYERDPRRWTWWDLLMATRTWRDLGMHVASTSLSREAFNVWRARAVARERVSERWTSVFGWEALFAAVAPMTAPDDTTVAAVGPAHFWIQRWPDAAFAAVPRDPGWLREDTAAPRMVGHRSVSVLDAVGWITSAKGLRPGAARAFEVLVASRATGSLASSLGLVSARLDAPPSADPTRRRALALVDDVLRAGTLQVAVARDAAALARSVAAVERLATQARTGRPARFVGDGRWWIPTLRAAVEADLTTVDPNVAP